MDLVILSHKRAGRVTTHKHISNCTLCVEESQADLYANAHPSLPIVTHPDSVVGLWQKRQWVKEHFGDHMQLDDDLAGIYRSYRPAGGWKKSCLGAERAYELCVQTAERCRSLGAYLFGFGQNDHPMTYDALRPFRFGGYTRAGCLGVLKGGKFWWPDVKLGDGDDYWVCLLNHHYHRFAFYDRRFTAAFGGHYDRYVADAGGLEEFRLDEEHEDQLEQEVLLYLQQHFGEVIQRPGPTARFGMGGLGRKQIQIPYRV